MISQIAGVLWIISAVYYGTLMSLNLKFSYEKKRLHLKCVLLALIVVGIFGILLMDGELFGKIFIILITIPAYFFVYKQCQFCPNCTAPSIRSGFWKTKFCPKCGHELKWE